MNTKDDHRGEGIIIAGPIKVYGPDLDSYMLIDPENGQIEAEGRARSVRRLMIHMQNAIGVTSEGSFDQAGSTSSISALELSSDENGGWNSMPIVIPSWIDTSIEIPIKGYMQWLSGDERAVVKARMSHTIARHGEEGIINTQQTIDIIPPKSGFDIVSIEEFGRIPANTLSDKDVIAVAIEVTPETAGHTYFDHTKLAKMAWLECTERTK